MNETITEYGQTIKRYQAKNRPKLSRPDQSITHKPEGKSDHNSDDGLRLLILGMIHGTEPCGRVAITHLIERLDNRSLTLKKGALTLVPVCNPLASERGVRYVDENLNRIMRHHPSPDTYEQNLANALIPLWEEADIILDFHSTQAPSHPYVFCEQLNPDLNMDIHRQEKDFYTHWIQAIQIKNIVCGWQTFYPSNGPEQTTESLTQANKKRGLTVECGQNATKEAAQTAIHVLYRSLAHFGLIDKSDMTHILSAQAVGNFEIADGDACTPECYKLIKMFRKEEGQYLARPWENFSHADEGDILFYNADGTHVRAPCACTIFLPKKEALTGWDWLYLAEKTKAPY